VHWPDCRTDTHTKTFTTIVTAL